MVWCEVVEVFFFFKQKTAYEMRMSDWSSDVCSSDLGERVMLWNMFVDMLQLLDTLVATHTDYAALRRALAGHDCLMFMRDALTKMSLELNRIALEDRKRVV